VVTGRCQVWVGNGNAWLDKMQFGAPDDEQCAARNMLSLQ
jgi:hypothetical protein